MPKGHTPIISGQRLKAQAMEKNVTLSTSADYFAMLAARRPSAEIIARELSCHSESGAKKLVQCGRYGIGTNPIELIRSGGVLRARGVKWCGLRYCPHCQPRMMTALQNQRAKRARAAAAAGLGIAFIQVGQPVGGVGELRALLNAQQADWKASLPPKSRLPASWHRAGLSDYLGLDYNIEIDWDRDAEHWHVHTHALAFRRSPWCADSLTFLLSRWSQPEPLAWGESAQVPEAAARYSVKAENKKDYILNLFDLARLEKTHQVAEYLDAVQGRRLRSPSAAVTKALKLPSAAEDERELMAWLEATPGVVEERMTPREWANRW